mgnify:CR=1 FL=1
MRIVKKIITFVLSFIFLMTFSLALLSPNTYAYETWVHNGIEMDELSPQVEDTTIKLSANIGGTTTGLKYKFVWMKEKWKSWGVIRDFDSSNNVDWKPTGIGNYTLCLDVKDQQGREATKQIDVLVHNGIKVDKKSPQVEDTTINLSTGVEGTTTDLEYKFVWMKENWKSWGVIKDFDSSNNVDWKPTGPGNYTLYLDIKDQKGRTITKTIGYKINMGWSHNGIKVDKQSPQIENTNINLSANVGGTTTGLKYKFVWMKENWKNWGVIKDFDSSNNVNWKPTNPGDYTLYLDIKDQKGRIVTKTIGYKINVGWVHNGIKVDKQSPQVEDTTIKLSADVGGTTTGLKYKFVWMKADWSSWGIIKDFNEVSSVNWIPSEAGSYRICLDIKDQNGKTETRSLNFRIDPSKGIQGIDVSEWQGNINWQSVKNSGVKFAMLRSGWSTGVDNPQTHEIDQRFNENVKKAKEVNMPIGVYHYSYARSVDEARQEAEHCLSIVSGYAYEYPIVFDIEDKKILEATQENKRIMTDIVKAFCNRIEQAGYYAAFYANPNWLDNYLYSNELLGRYDLWLAQWNIESPSKPCGIWQYSSEGYVPGIDGKVDLDYAYIDYPSLMKSHKLNGY